MNRQIVALLVLIAVLGFGIAETDAAGLLVPRDGSAAIQVKSHRVTATLTDGLARTTLRQTFVNPHPRELEAIYVFPVPEGAALTDVAMEVGGKRFEGLLVERRRARKIYNDIVRQKKDPALVEQIGRNTFRLSVFPVLPGKDTVVELTWVQQIPLTQGLLRYVYPLRLVQEPGVKTQQDFTIVLDVKSSGYIDPYGEYDRRIEVKRTHATSLRFAMEKMRVRLSDDVVFTSRVSVLEPKLTVSTFRGPKGDGWFRAVVTPPMARPKQLIPRDVLLLLDTSGSMRGTKITQAKAAAIYLLSNLRPGDRANVIRFSTAMESFAREPVTVDLMQLAELKQFVDGTNAGGGTALGDVVRSVRELPAAEGRVRTVVLISDGLPTVGETDPGKIVTFAREAGSKGFRIFSFGVGRDLEAGLLRGISRASRGKAEIFGPEDELASRLQVFLDRTASPVISDIKLAVSGVRIREVYPRPIPDAYLGEQVILLGRYEGSGAGDVMVSGTVGRKKAALAQKVSFPAEPSGDPSVAKLYAIEALSFLEEALRLRLGLNDDAYYAALDRGAYSTSDEIVAEMIRISMEHGVQCAYTSFLVLLPEDRHRLDPRQPEELTAALGRVRRARRELSSGGEGGEPGENPAADPDMELEEVLRRRKALEKSGFGFGAGGNAGASSGPSTGGNAGAGAGGVSDGTGSGGGGDDGAGAPPPSGAGTGGGEGGGRPGGATGPGGPGTPGPSGKAVLPAKRAVPAFYAERLKPRVMRGRPLSQREREAVDKALVWLAANQEANGNWVGGTASSDKWDVGVTGLAVLTFLGTGDTPLSGKYARNIARGLTWLMAQQDAEGCFGLREPKIKEFTYNHAIATRAVVEAYGLTGSLFLERSAQAGIDFIQKCQNPYLAWRYGVRPKENDTSVSAWMVFALQAGREAGLNVDHTGFEGMKAWLDKVTEPEYGRAGYTTRGTGPARPADMMDRFPPDKSESLTAAAILCRVFIGESPRKSEMIQKGAELCLKALPAWDEASGSIDMYYWYFGSLALFQVGGDTWKAWKKALLDEVLPNQRQDAEFAGSWDPIGPFGSAGGRVYSTALMATALQAEWIYPRLHKAGTGRGGRGSGRIR